MSNNSINVNSMGNAAHMKALVNEIKVYYDERLERIK